MVRSVNIAMLTKLTAPLGMQNQQAGNDWGGSANCPGKNNYKTPEVREGLPQPCSSGCAACSHSGQQRLPHTDISPAFLFLPGTGSGWGLNRSYKSPKNSFPISHRLDQAGFLRGRHVACLLGIQELGNKDEWTWGAEALSQWSPLTRSHR